MEDVRAKAIDDVKVMLEKLLTTDSPCSEANRAFILGHVDGMKTWRDEGPATTERLGTYNGPPLGSKGQTHGVAFDPAVSEATADKVMDVLKGDRAGVRQADGSVSTFAALEAMQVAAANGMFPPPVTLEGLGAVIPQLIHAAHALRTDEAEVYESAKRTLLAALKRTREVLGVDEDDLSDGDVGSPSMVMTMEQMQALVAEHIKAHQAHMSKEERAGYAAGYNRAVVDAANVLPDVYGPGSEDTQGIKAQHAIMALHKAGVGELALAVVQVNE